MSLSTDRPGKFLFGCLIVVLCAIIGAGLLKDGGWSDASANVRDGDVQQTASESTSSLPFESFRWALQHEPIAFYCFLAGVVVWVTGVIGRQFLILSRNDGERTGHEDEAELDLVTWRTFDVLVSLVILGSASVLLVRRMGPLFALLICVTTLVCYFLAYGPRILAVYFREAVRWLDDHYAANMVNGDLPLGKIKPSAATRLILPSWWWQSSGEDRATVGAVPAGLMLMVVGALLTLGMVSIFGSLPHWTKPETTHLAKGPALLPTPASHTVLAAREVRNDSIELDALDDRMVELGVPLVVAAKLDNPDKIEGDVHFSLAPGAPAGAKIDAETGVIVWTPDQVGKCSLTVRARSDAPGRPSDEKTFAVLVQPSSRLPEVLDIPDRKVNEGDLVVVPVKVKNRARLRTSLQFRLGAGAPEGAQIDSDSGVITWKPTKPGSHRFTVQVATPGPESHRIEKSFNIVVDAAARPPELVEIDDKVINQGELLLVSAKVHDPSHIQGDLQYHLGKDAPTGAEIDEDSGLITWKATAPGAYHFTVIAATDAPATPHDQKTFRVLVKNVNRPPVLARIDDKVVNEGESLVMTVKLKDPGLPRATLRFSLRDDSPEGATIEPASGLITWTPPKPGTYHLTVQCESTAPGGLSDQHTFAVLVHEVSHPPQLVDIGNKIVKAGDPLLVAVKVKDPGRPRGSLQFSLSSDAPDGCQLDPGTGHLRWTPDDNVAAGEYPITVRVRNALRPSLTDAVTFNVIVLRTENMVRSKDEPLAALELSPIAHQVVDAEDVSPRPIPHSRPPQSEANNDIAGLLESQPIPREVSPLDRPSPADMVSQETSDREPFPIGDAPAERTDNEPGQSFTNSIGMELQVVPQGVYLMGTRESAEEIASFADVDLSQYKDELPSHPVRITKPFLMGKHEVTIGEFRQFVDETQYKTDAERNDQGAFAFHAESHQFKWGAQYNWQNTGWSQSNDHPVVNMSWTDAVAFCKWLSKKEGRIYRLPTEAEWEYACRAGTETRYSSGDSVEELAEVANLGEEAFRQIVRPGYAEVVQVALDEGHPLTTSVGKFKPNAFGLCDMHGNVFEWCQDWYGAHYYKESPLNDPAGPEHGTKRSIRGGSFFNSPFYTRSSFRNGFPPNTSVPYLGFRVVMELDAESEAEATPSDRSNENR